MRISMLDLRGLLHASGHDALTVRDHNLHGTDDIDLYQIADQKIGRRSRLISIFFQFLHQPENLTASQDHRPDSLKASIRAILACIGRDMVPLFDRHEHFYVSVNIPGSRFRGSENRSFVDRIDCDQPAQGHGRHLLLLRK